VAIALAAVVLGGCPIFDDKSSLQPAGSPTAPWDDAGPVRDAAAALPDAGAADAGPDGATDDAVEETGADAEGDASSGQAVDGDGGASPAETDAVSDTPGDG
jgi:hypothetical protein